MEKATCSAERLTLGISGQNTGRAGRLIELPRAFHSFTQAAFRRGREAPAEVPLRRAARPPHRSHADSLRLQLCVLAAAAALSAFKRTTRPLHLHRINFHLILEDIACAPPPSDSHALNAYDSLERFARRATAQRARAQSGLAFVQHLSASALRKYCTIRVYMCSTCEPHPTNKKEMASRRSVPFPLGGVVVNLFRGAEYEQYE